ncbi:hypothetical protein DXG03_008233 [Asterophora parasitica]|uniref:Uncharacterized protein n=1 Tax=Asterophora parasitica TaxID=117018 RepID=A0A9P7K7Z6_9AGAR|nr:hypothetical protein DXG03_008233 [Asterophora parasitica]
MRTGAGKTYSVNDVDENQSYEKAIGDAGNIYAPFSSQLEWEIVKWAKLCGASSTAFTELMSIQGVVDRLGLSFKNTNELNKIVDSLPGRP